MTTLIEKARTFLKQEKLDYLLINSTNQFLVEYNSLDENSRYHITNFSGSTGDAVLSKDHLWLFVDGRYHIQADLEVNKDITTVVKLQLGQKPLDAMFKFLEPDTTFAIVSKKNSQIKYENLQKLFALKNISVKLLSTDIIENTSIQSSQVITEIPKSLTGLSSDEKIKHITEHLADDEAIFVNNLEDVSYILNIRNFNKANASSVNAKLIITKEKTLLYKDENLKNFEIDLENLKNIKKIYTSKATTNAFDYELLSKNFEIINENKVSLLRTIKTDAEIEHYKDAFKRTDKALLATREFIEENDNISEFDICKKLEEEYKKNGAISQSFTSIVAKDKNSALAHYSKSSKEEIIQDGSLILIDCGGFFEGGLATDITRVFVKGTPSNLQKEVYTKVLKSFLKAFYSNKNNGFEIDKTAREYLNQIAPEGFTFSHGLGHGIGINVHECPPNLSAMEIANSEIVDNMCFTIEPGLYKENQFGVRLENSCFMKNGKIHSFSNMCYEKKLIDFSLLSDEEVMWLKNFEVK